MKFINKKICIVMSIAIICSFFTISCKNNTESSYDFNSLNLVSSSSNQGADNKVSFFADDLCVIGDEDRIIEDVNMDLAEAAALFDTTTGEVVYAKNVHERLYPASTTKILTALVALENGNLNDIVEITPDCLKLESGASKCGFAVGDKPTLSQVLNGFLIYSGNDAGVAIANHISGSVEEFAKLMNEKAKSLGATNSHFVNPHGLHDENHYTTAYDLYLIFNEAIKNKEFKNIIGKTTYTASFPGSNGEIKEITWTNTNRYFKGTAKTPANMNIIGSKTGTTNEAGACLVLLSENASNNKPYISIILKSSDAGTMYVEMNELLNLIN